MKTFPSYFAAEKNKKTDISPVWVLKVTVAGVDYYISDQAFTIPAMPSTGLWPNMTPITTVPWVSKWGEVREGINSSLGEVKVSDLDISFVIDQSANPNIETLTTQNIIEASPVALFSWYLNDGDYFLDSATLTDHWLAAAGNVTDITNYASSIISGGTAYIKFSRTGTAGSDYRTYGKSVTIDKTRTSIYTVELKNIAGTSLFIYLTGSALSGLAFSQQRVLTLSNTGIVTPGPGCSVLSSSTTSDGYARIRISVPPSFWNGTGSAVQDYTCTNYTAIESPEFYYRNPSMVQLGTGCLNPPQAIFSGRVRDVDIPDDTTVTWSLQDDSVNLEQTYIGTLLDKTAYPYADPDDVGKMLPIVFGTVKKAQTLALLAGLVTSLPAGITSTATTITLTDATGLEIGNLLNVDSETMQITGISGNTLSVSRGYMGTIAATHQRGAVAWQNVGDFVYAVAGHAVTSISKVYCRVGQSLMDITSICYIVPNDSNFGNMATVWVPGLITLEQAVSLAVTDGIAIDNSLSPYLTGGVSKTGTVGKAGGVSKTGTASLNGGVVPSGSVTLAGLISLIGAINDPGHTHPTGQSTSETCNTGLPTSGYSWSGSASWGSSGQYSATCYGQSISFPNDGARSDATYSISVKFSLSVGQVSGPITIIAIVNGSTKYYYDYSSSPGVVANNSTFSFSFSAGSADYDTIQIVTPAIGYGYIQVTSASRTIMLTGLTSGGNSAYVSKGSLNTNSTLSIGSQAGINNTLALVDGIGVTDTLTISDSTGVISSLDVDLSGGVSKTGTIEITGNSVANTLVGDAIFVDVTAPTTAPSACFQFLLNLCSSTPLTLTQVGAMPVGYSFNGQLTERELALKLFARMALQCRSYFRIALGMAQLIVRPDVTVSAKTIPACVMGSDGRLQVARHKTPREDVINRINLLYNRDYMADSYDEKSFKAVAKGSDTGSIAVYGTCERPELFWFDLVTDSSMADSLLNFYKLNYAYRKWVYEFRAFLDHSELEFADGVTLGFMGNRVVEIQEVKSAPGDKSNMDTIGIIAIG